MNIGDLFIRILADDKEFQGDVVKKAGKAGENSGKAFGKAMTSNIKTAMGAIGVTVGAAAVVDFLTDAISAASDLNESMSKSGVIFGESSEDIEAWADTAADSFGQSKREALDAASGFAGLFSTVGIGLDQSTEMAQKLTELGSDLASFFNTDVATALGALKSGLSGESEPLRAFNVFLSETAVTAKLAEMGIKKVGGSFTEAQKATARYALILEQTGSAQGDFERTSDGLANTQKTLAAQMENLSAEIGQEFLPVALELATFVREELIPVFRDTLQVAKDLAPVFGFLGDAAQNFVDPLGRTKEALIEEAIAAEKARQASEEWAEQHRAGERPTLDAAAATDTLADETVDLEQAMKDAEDAARDLESAISDLGDLMYGHTITAGELAEAQQELADLMEEGADATRPGDWTIYQGNLAEAKKKVFELQAQMAQQEGPEAFLKWLEAQEAAVSDTDTEILQLIQHMKDLAKQAVTTSKAPIIGSGGRNVAGGQTAYASGGYWPGTYPAIVGEEGPELLIPGTSPAGTIVPSFASMSIPDPRAWGSAAARAFANGGDPRSAPGATTNLNLTFTGKLGDTKKDVVLALQRAAAFPNG